MGISSQDRTDANDNSTVVLKDDSNASIGQAATNPLFISPVFSPGNAPADFFFEVRRGNIAGIIAVSINGYNPDVKNIEEDIWDPGGIHSHPTTASVLDIVSTDANDSAAGTGVRTLLIRGLDSSYNEISETITMNGLTTVPTVNSYLRFRDAVALTAGTARSNVGDISITHNGSGFLQGQMLVGFGITHNSMYTIPAGKTAFAIDTFLSNSQGNSALFKLKSEKEGGPIITPVLLDVGVTPFLIPSSTTGITEKTDVKLSAVTGTGSSVATARFVVYLVDN
jgi:hypothetical protein